jgi:hypothetical protein
MNDAFPAYRITSAARALHYSFEKGGLVLHDQPIPWSAEAVLVEANLHLPTVAMRDTADFQLLIPHQEPVRPDSIRPQSSASPGENRYAVVFRLPTPAHTLTVTLLWRNRELGRIELPVLTRSAFLDSLNLHLPTLSVRLGDEAVVCRTFVASQGKGLLATALLRAPTSLAPLLDFDLGVAFADERQSVPTRVAVRLSSSQLAERQALITVAPRKVVRGTGLSTVTWLLGDRELARQEVRSVTLRQFQRSLRVSATRFIQQAEDGSVRVARHLCRGEQQGRNGPCFLLCSRLAGMAGLCSLRVTARVAGAVASPLLWEQEALITDGPTVIAPGTLDAAELSQVEGFELSFQGRTLCRLPLSPAPTALFTSEGGFRPPTTFDWSSAADDELDQRLGRLLEERFRQN